MTPEPGSNPDAYWADLPTEEFAKEAFRQFATPAGGPAGIFQQLQWSARQAFYGAMPMEWWSGPSSAQVGRDGVEGNIVTLKVNNLRSHALAQHQIVTAPELSWQAQAVNSDSKSMASASRGSKILEYLWKNNEYGEQLIRAVLGAIIYGEEFIFAPWSDMAGEPVAFDKMSGRVQYAGDIEATNVPSWDVLRDPSAHSFEESDWVCVRLWQNRWDLIAQYPEAKDKILALGLPQTSLDNTSIVDATVLQPSNRDRIPVYYFFHKVTRAMPIGRQAILLSGDLVLADGPLEPCYREVLPLHRMNAGDLKGTPYPYASLWEAMAAQELADDVQGSLATNIVTFGKNIISIETGTNLPIYAVANGPQVIERAKGAPKPEVLNLCASPPEAFEHLERLRQDIRQTFGLNDIVMGQPDTAQMNAQAFALIASMAITQNSDLQKRFVKCATRMGRSMLRIYRAKASIPRKVAIVGKHGPLNAIQDKFTGNDFSELDDVFVEVASPLAQTAAGRLQLAQMYTAQGFVPTPEQLQSVVETGRLDPLTQGLQAELIYIAEENEQLLKGEQVMAKITDSHQLHIREHRATTFSAQARANPQVNVVSDGHIKSHLDFLLNTDPRILAAMGQAAPMPPMMPGATQPPARGAESGTPPPAPGPTDSTGPLADPLAQQTAEANGIPAIQQPQSPLNGQQFDAAAQPVLPTGA